MANSWLANPRATREVLERHDLMPKHRLGQNFLVNDEVIGRILALAELEGTDVVYEVGPGIGTLTVALLAHAKRVVAVEADRTLPAVLAETCERDGDKLALVQGDALKVDAGQLAQAAGEMPTKLVSNLPYQVAATLVLDVLEHMPSVGRIVVMVQAEVADRMAARPASRQYGAYTAKLRLFGQVTGRFEVGAGNFMPPPHVESAVVRIDRATMDLPEGIGLAQVCRVIDASFAQRRKTLRNSLSANGFDKRDIDVALGAAGVDGRSRAEVLSPEDFVRIAKNLPDFK